MRGPLAAATAALALGLGVSTFAGSPATVSAGALTDELRLTLLHSNDGESALLPDEPIGGVARFATIVDELRAAGDAPVADMASGTLVVSSGDNFLAGPQLQASLANFSDDDDFTNDGPFYDALALDLMDYDASAVGNHEFDFGPSVLAYFMSEFDTTNMRFVSSNLDVTGDAALAAFVDATPETPEGGTLVEWTRTSVDGQDIAIVGATTPRLPGISSPGPDVVVDEDVAGAVQDAITAATSDGTEIVILISHLQNINEDLALVPQLGGVDIAVAGGGDELLANDDDLLLPGTDAGDVFGTYPMLASNGVPVVTTQGSYSYVGQLIVVFNQAGGIDLISDESGPVRNVYVPSAPPADQRDPDPEVLAQVEAPVQAHIDTLANEVVAHTDVALDGVRANVRTRETNLGSLFADALRVTAETEAPEFGATNPTVALQNSGGIRNDSVLGPDVDITTLDTFDIAPFSNFVGYTLDVTPAKLKEILERSVSADTDDEGVLLAEGRFGQVSGIEFRYDPRRTAQVVDRQPDGTIDITTPGDRVRHVELTLNDDDPSNDIVVVADGQLVAGAPNVDLAANSFTLGNGDDYPFNLGGAFTNLPTSYQQSLENYLTSLGTVTAADYPEGGLGRIVAEPLIQAMAPTRLADTRPGWTASDGMFTGTGPVSAGGILEVQVAGRMGIPDGATAALLNLTFTNTQAPGFATMYPCTATVPEASSVNYQGSVDRANELIAPLSAEGTVCVFTDKTANIVIDAMGYVPEVSLYRPLQPTRLADTRPGWTAPDGQFTGTGPVGAGQVLQVQVAGRGGIPAGAPSAVLNLTFTNTAEDGFATLYPCTATVPEASSLNYLPSTDVANEVIAKLSADGKVCVYTWAPANIVIDAVGYVPPGPTEYVPLNPTRIADTRDGWVAPDGQFTGTNHVAAGGILEVQVAGRAGVPTDAPAAVLNLTFTETLEDGFATLYPCSPTVPEASSLNYLPGTDVANEVVARLSSTGKVCVYTFAAANIVIDVVGHL